MKIAEAVEKLKAKTVVKVTDVEEFLELIIYVGRDMQRLRESRDKWRKKYEEAKANNKM